MEASSIGAFAEAVIEYGFPLVLSIILIWYVYKNQLRIEVRNDKREQQSYDREVEHRKFIEALKNDLQRVACENNNIVREINQDVDTVHAKIVNLGHDVDSIKVDVRDIKKDVDHIRFTGIHIAKGED